MRRELKNNRMCELRAGQRGAVLIIALGVLTIMAVLGTAFASLMRLERRATDNYLESRRMDFLLDSALWRAVAELEGAKNFRSFSVFQDNPWLYKLRGEGSLAHGRVDLNDPRVSRWEMFARRAGTEQWYNTKVLDCSSQINLNGQQDTLARMLDNLGEAIEKSERLKRDGKRVTNPFYSGPNRSGQRLRGQQIVQLRRRLPNGRFTSKLQLRQLIGRENYEIVKDFVACYGYEDPYTYKPLDGLNEVLELRGGGSAGVGGAQAQTQEPASGAPRIGPEPRYPVNINTAPEEVLISCIQGLAGRRIFPFSFIGASVGGANAAMVPIDSSAQVLGRRVPGQEETGAVLPRAIFVYAPRIEYQNAKKLADRIIAERKIRPFMTWRSNDPNRKGFEDFIDLLEPSFFPSPSNAVIIDPDQPQNQQIRRTVIAGSADSPVVRLWRKGTAQGSLRSLYRNAGIAFHDLNAWFYELAKGVLKANFNPNTRLNRYNPNPPAYVPVDKSDLVWAQTQIQLFKGHTTEFCFDTNGYYEITTVGQIGPISDRDVGAGRTKVGRRGQRRSQVKRQTRGSQRGLAPPFKRPFQRKVRTIVKTFGVLRHTSQYHFEKTFSAALSSANNRKFVVTWPDPMEALTELYSGGSQRDGRIELAGLLDGRRQQMQYANRTQAYQNPSLTMAQGFDARSSKSIADLRRALTSGGVSALSEPVTDALRDLLDLPYSAFGGRHREYYRRSRMLALNAYPNPNAVPREPEINKEEFGTDILPDGFHSSILRTSHLDSKAWIIPARTPVSQGREESAAVPVGASGVASRGQNRLGNVPYYRGGIAFWVKLDFDGGDPVFSGLIGCTQVVKEVTQNGGDPSGSEGTQFFIFKNSRGDLRVVRLYYHQAFLQGLGEGGGTANINTMYPQAPPDSENNPIREHLDPRKAVARADLPPVSISHWRAHEWHHIGIDWNDEQPSNALRLYLDFQEIRSGGGPIFPQAELAPMTSWVRLNERQPRDGLQVGGIIRDQADKSWGIFKWFTTTAKVGQGRSGVMPVSTNVKRLMANATIDEVVSFEGVFPTVRSYYAGGAAPGYFTNQNAEYANVFEVPLSAQVGFVVLRSLDWTSYYPTFYTDSLPNSIPQSVRMSETLQCQVTYVPASGDPAIPGAFTEPWRVQEPTNRVAGRRAARRSTGIRGANVEVFYRFRFRGAQSRTGSTAGGVVGTPVVDDVTLTYFLPNPKILLQEEIE